MMTECQRSRSGRAFPQQRAKQHGPSTDEGKPLLKLNVSSLHRTGAFD